MTRNNHFNIGNFVISIIAIGLSLFATIKSCISDKKFEITNYKITSVEHRPKLKLSNPEIVSIELNSDSIPTKQSEDITDSIADITFKVSLKLKIKITNIGNSTAKITGFAATDTISDLDLIRALLFDTDKDHISKNENFRLSKQLQEIDPLDSVHIEFNYSPMFIADNKFIIHVLIFYENELDQLFDTYYWMHFEANEMIFENPLFYNGDLNKWKKLSRDIFKVVEVKNENNYSEIYSQKQRNELIEHYNK